MADDKMWTPDMKVPQDEDSASAGRKPKKNEKGMPEQPGSAIRVDGKPVKYAKGGVTRADGCISKGHTKGKIV